MTLAPSNIKQDYITTDGFTDDQQKAYDNLLEWIKKPFDAKDYRRCVIGAAGVGKTFLIRAVISNCNISYSKIGLAAPTHKATRVLKNSIGNGISCSVKTLQSDLGLRLNMKSDKFDVNHPPFDPQGSVKIGEFQLYIVDEASMVSKSLQTLLERFCLQSEVKLIEMGDESQLPPVEESFSSAFRNCKICRLNKVVRQDDDNPVKQLLNMLRKDIQYNTYSFLEYIGRHKYQMDETGTKGYYVCSDAEFRQAVINNFGNDIFTKDIDYCRIVAYTNARVKLWNEFVRNSLVKGGERAVITSNDLLLSYVTIVDDFLSPVITNTEEYIIKDIVNFTHKTYNLKGFLVRFISIHGGDVTKPLFIVDYTDNYSLQKYYRLLKEKEEYGRKVGGKAGWTPYYNFKNEILMINNICDRTGRIIVNRDLDYGFALTSHKAQGSTFENVLVDVNDIVYDKTGTPYTNAEDINRRLYVACSRCRNKLYLRYGQ